MDQQEQPQEEKQKKQQQQQSTKESSETAAKDALGVDQHKFLQDLWYRVEDDGKYPNLTWQPGEDGFIVKDRRKEKEYDAFKEELFRWGFQMGVSSRSSAELCADMAKASGAPQERDFWHHEDFLFCREDRKKKFKLLRSITPPKDRPTLSSSPDEKGSASKSAQDEKDATADGKKDHQKEKGEDPKVATTKKVEPKAENDGQDNERNGNDDDDEDEEEEEEDYEDEDDDYHDYEDDDDYDDDDDDEDDDDDDEEEEAERAREEARKNQPAPIQCLHVPVLKRPDPSGKGTYRVPIMQEEILEKCSTRFWTIVKQLMELHFHRQLILQGYNPDEPDADNIDSKVATESYASFFDQLGILQKMSYLPPLPKNYNEKPVNFGDTFRLYNFIQDEFDKEMRKDPKCENPQDPEEKSHLAFTKAQLKKKLQVLMDSHFWEEKEDRQDDFVSTVAAMNALARQLEILKRISFRGQH